MITIEKVNSTKQINSFIDFPHDLYKGNPNYVPEIFLGQKDLLNKKKHPFFEHSKADLFLAYRDNKIVGRIAAIRNNNHIEFTGKQEGFFGFFETIEDYEVAKKLFDTATEWVKKEGLKGIVGPTNFSTNETCGWLINAYDQPPVISMTYSPAYYLQFAEKYGLVKKVDLHAYLLSQTGVSKKALAVATSFEERLKTKGITIRKVNMKKFDEDVQASNEVYNKAWDKNMGFVPMTNKEFVHLCNDMKMIMDVDFCYVAEHDGKMIGFSFSLPDINQVLIKIKRGRLLPTGIFKLLFLKNKIKKIRVVVLGVIDGYRRMGIEACFYARTINTAIEKNIESAEASWILENNEMMTLGLKNLNAEIYKTYRLYELPL